MIRHAEKALTDDPRAYIGIIILVATCVGLGLFAAENSTVTRSGMALAAILFASGFAYAGRADITRPEYLLPTIWFAAVALAQVHLLAGYQTPWSARMVLVAFATPLVFAAGSAIGGTGAARPSARTTLEGVDASRLRIIGCFLLAVGFVGIALKAQRIGGIALFSNEIDSLRSAGGIKIPAWLTMMTNSLFLGSWSLLLAGSIRPRGAARALDFSLAVVGVVGVAFGASRNTILITLLVPTIYAYLSGTTRAASKRTITWMSVLAIVVALVASGLFFVRTGQHRKGTFENAFYSYVVPDTPQVLRPFLPVYIGLTAPLETLNRTTIRSESAATGVTYFFPGIPPAITPFGPRGDFYAFTRVVSRPYYFNVATFVGAPYLDGGVVMATLIALLMGFILGLVRRLLLRNPTVPHLAVVAYTSYLVTFLIYENLATLYTPSIVFDLLVIWMVLSACSDRRVHFARVSNAMRIDPELARA